MQMGGGALVTVRWRCCMVVFLPEKGRRGGGANGFIFGADFGGFSWCFLVIVWVLKWCIEGLSWWLESGGLKVGK